MESSSAKPQADPYKNLCEDVKTFITSFYQHIKTNNLVEIENDYAVKFPKLTDQYFKSTRWPSVDIIAPLVNKDPWFMMLYNELYYRHLYAHVSSFPDFEEAHQSYVNYCAFFEALIKPKKPVILELPNQWLWDIIDEFIYQFQKFSISRTKSKKKPEDEAFLRQNPRTWSIHGILNILFQLVEKSNINAQLNCYAAQRTLLYCRFLCDPFDTHTFLLSFTPEKTIYAILFLLHTSFNCVDLTLFPFWPSDEVTLLTQTTAPLKASAIGTIYPD
ncbi:unnamed protein product [Dibothriocephalus latus]|uniref:Eukaryotic translation initiation factor 3 subunit L n=1 Tax=Dibothriocephalus latus TaxID=60516 RepID=A0A3P6RL13_DIBLA|nr:unnamed protein product [Dibothriocephalus latus]